MIAIELLPDGAAELPAEAKDHGVLATHLDGNGPPNSTPAGRGWRSVEREVTRDRLVLRLPGSVSDYQQATLDGVATAITANVNGVKAHPDGWQNVAEEGSA